MNVERLEQLNQSNALPAAVQRRIAEVLSEDPEYAADELVEKLREIRRLDDDLGPTQGDSVAFDRALGEDIGGI